MTLVAGITLAVAVLGAVLGVVNTWRMLDASRVKLRVSPRHAIMVGVQPDLNFCICVTNLSGFPVTIREVGVTYSGTDKRGVFLQPVFDEPGPWPRRLESRSSITVYGQRPSRLPGHRIAKGYAETQCGVVAKGTSPALRQISTEVGS